MIRNIFDRMPFLLIAICAFLLGAGTVFVLFPTEQKGEPQVASSSADNGVEKTASTDATAGEYNPEAIEASGIRLDQKPYESEAEPTLQEFQYRVLWGNCVAVEDMLQQNPQLAKMADRREDGTLDTPLSDAVFAARFPEEGIPIMKLLLDYGANPNVYGGGDELFSALSWGHDEAANLLLDRGARVNFRNHARETPLHTAIQPRVTNSFCRHTDSNLDLVTKIIQKGADVNAKDNEGRTPLHQAAAGGNTRIITALLDAGADVNPVDNWGQTPLDVALGAKEQYCFVADQGQPLCEKNEAAIEMLRTAGARPSSELRKLSAKESD